MHKFFILFFIFFLSTTEVVAAGNMIINGVGVDYPSPVNIVVNENIVTITKNDTTLRCVIDTTTAQFLSHNDSCVKMGIQITNSSVDSSKKNIRNKNTIIENNTGTITLDYR